MKVAKTSKLNLALHYLWKCPFRPLHKDLFLSKSRVWTGQPDLWTLHYRALLYC